MPDPLIVAAAQPECRANDVAANAVAHAAAIVAFESCAGPTGGGFDRTAGSSTISSPAGTVVARASRDPGELARAVIA